LKYGPVLPLDTVTAMLPLISGSEMRFNYIDVTSGDNYILQTSGARVKFGGYLDSDRRRAQRSDSRPSRASMTALALMLLASSLTTAAHVGGRLFL
jgi:hypothetical protein